MRTWTNPPEAAMASAISIKVCVLISIPGTPALYSLRSRKLGSVDGFCEPHFLAVVPRSFPKARPSDAGRAVAAFSASGCIFSSDLINHDVLGRYDISLEANDLCNVGNAARTITKPRRLDDDINRGNNHFTDGFRRQRESAHRDHRFETADCFAGRVCMQSTHRAVVAGVHGLQEIERFRPAHLADDDPFRAHAQAISNEIAHCDGAISFEIWRTRFKPDNVRLLQLQLGGIFAGDDPLIGIDIIGQAIEKSGLS